MVRTGHHKRRAAAGAGAGGIIISNGSTVDFDCDSLTGWNDADAGNGVSTQVTYDSRSTFKLAGGATYNASNTAERNKVLSVPAGDRITFSLVIDPIVLSSGPDTGWMGSFLGILWLYGNTALYMFLFDDMLYTYNTASTWTKVADLTGVTTGTHTLTADVTGIATTTPIADFYFDDALVGTGVDVKFTTGGAAGKVSLIQYSRIEAAYTEKLSYIDRVLIGDGLA